MLLLLEQRFGEQQIPAPADVERVGGPGFAGLLKGAVRILQQADDPAEIAQLEPSERLAVTGLQQKRGVGKLLSDQREGNVSRQ